jgi:hypothetical protein
LARTARISSPPASALLSSASATPGQRYWKLDAELETGLSGNTRRRRLLPIGHPKLG